MDANQFKQQQAKGNRLAKLKPYLTCHLELMDYLTNFKRSQEGYREITEFEVKTQLGLPDPPPFAEKKMLMDEDWIESMRQYCLMSVAQRGLSSGMLETLSRRLVQRFGLAMIDDLLKMQRGSLLYEQVPGYMFWADRLPAWEDLRKHFELQVDPKAPNDLGGSFEGWVPLICRIIHMIAIGKRFTSTQKSLLEKNKTPYLQPDTRTRREDDEKASKRRIMVFVIGGLTETEISLIRQISELCQGTCEFYLGTTSILTGKHLVRELAPTMVKALKAQAVAPTT
jgi:hypothetical protein